MNLKTQTYELKNSKTYELKNLKISLTKSSPDFY